MRSLRYVHQSGDVLGRMVHIKASAGELYYLRLLLLHCRGDSAVSFDALKSFQPDGLATHQQLAREMGLLHGDAETVAEKQEK